MSGPRERPPAPEPLPVPVADSHCHLDIADPPDDWLSVEEALAEVDRGRGAAHRADRLRPAGCALGGRDRRAARRDRRRRRPAPQRGAAARRGRRRSTRPWPRSTPWRPTRVVRAVGETGLDYFRTGPDGRDVQEASFRAHIEMAKRHGKALVIHDRDAHDDVLRVLDDAGAARPGRLPLLLRRRRDGRALRAAAAGGCPSPAR